MKRSIQGESSYYKSIKTIFKIAKAFVTTVALFTLTSAYVLQAIAPIHALYVNYWVLSWYLIGKAEKHYKIYLRYYKLKYNKNAKS